MYPKPPDSPAPPRKVIIPAIPPRYAIEWVINRGGTLPSGRPNRKIYRFIDATQRSSWLALGPRDPAAPGFRESINRPAILMEMRRALRHFQASHPDARPDDAWQPIPGPAKSGECLPAPTDAIITTGRPRRTQAMQPMPYSPPAPPLPPTAFPPGSPLAKLTPRQLETLSAIALGKEDAEIALPRGLSVHTIREHTRQIFRKLGVHDRVTAGRIYREAVKALEPTASGQPEKNISISS